jgi:hypothetical protein
MRLKPFYLLMLIVLCVNKLWGQESSAVTETQPMATNGLEIGYQAISNESRPGNFKRYRIKFYVTNKRTEPKIIFFKDDGGEIASVSDEIARFVCLNATGADGTVKTATILGDPCVVTGLVDIKDCNVDKTIQVKKSTQIGYWIKPGQTISSDQILIVPSNEEPKVQAYYMVGAKPADNSSESGAGAQNGASSSINLQDFLTVKNKSNNTYLNVQTGPPTSTEIKKGWFSAQWLFVPVTGTSYYNIQSKWHQNFIDVDSKGSLILSPNGQGNSSIWILSPTSDANVFKIRNVQSGSFLGIDNKNAILTTSSGDVNSSWVLEAP